MKHRKGIKTRRAAQADRTDEQWSQEIDRLWRQTEQDMQPIFDDDDHITELLKHIDEQTPGLKEIIDGLQDNDWQKELDACEADTQKIIDELAQQGPDDLTALLCGAAPDLERLLRDSEDLAALLDSDGSGLNTKDSKIRKGKVIDHVQQRRKQQR